MVVGACAHGDKAHMLLPNKALARRPLTASLPSRCRVFQLINVVQHRHKADDEGRLHTLLILAAAAVGAVVTLATPSATYLRHRYASPLPSPASLLNALFPRSRADATATQPFSAGLCCCRPRASSLSCRRASGEQM